MTEHRVEDEEGQNEDTRRKRAIRACCCCRKHDKRVRESVDKERLRDSVDLGEELLPGIPDDITLEFITPKISWRDLHVLRSVSRTWQKAIQSHLVYESRVRSQSTETLALVAYRKPSRGYLYSGLSLYSPRDGTWNKLPRNRYRPKGFLPEGECVSLHGKLYILGGVQRYGRRPENGEQPKVGSREVYVLDLAGQRRWKKCSDMLEPRLKFGCGVVDGKIYVFGGTSDNKPLSGCEVYDPEVNTWSRIKPMKTLRFGHGVFKVGQKLFVHGGEFYRSRGDGPGLERRGPRFLEVYDPVKDKWRLTGAFESYTQGRIFTAEGKVYLITESGIDHSDIDKLTHAHAQSFCRAGNFGWSRWQDTIVVDHELLALVYVTDSIGCYPGLMRSKGFGNEKEDIVWEKCAVPSSKPGVICLTTFGIRWHTESMWAIQI